MGAGVDHVFGTRVYVEFRIVLSIEPFYVFRDVKVVNRNYATLLGIPLLDFSVFAGHREVAVEKSLDDRFCPKRKRGQSDLLTKFSPA